jgi:hypothetical protein
MKKEHQASSPGPARAKVEPGVTPPSSPVRPSAVHPRDQSSSLQHMIIREQGLRRLRQSDPLTLRLIRLRQ